MKSFNIIILVAFILLSCKKETVVGPQGPQGPPGNSPPGKFMGKVTQYNQYGEKYKTGLNTTTVTLKGTTNSAVTDAAGGYTLGNVPEGTHEFQISRPGSRTMTMQQMHMIGNGTFFYNLDVADTAGFVLTKASTKDTLQYGDPSVKMVVETVPDPKQRTVLALISSSKNMDPADPNTYDEYVMISIGKNASVGMYMTFSNYPELPYTSGQTYFIKFFPCSGYNATTYDYLSEKTVFHTTGKPFPTVFAHIKP